MQILSPSTYIGHTLFSNSDLRPGEVLGSCIGVSRITPKKDSVIPGIIAKMRLNLNIRLSILKDIIITHYNIIRDHRSPRFPCLDFGLPDILRKTSDSL